MPSPKAFFLHFQGQETQNLFCSCVSHILTFWPDLALPAAQEAVYLGVPCLRRSSPVTLRTGVLRREEASAIWTVAPL